MSTQNILRITAGHSKDASVGDAFEAAADSHCNAYPGSSGKALAGSRVDAFVDSQVIGEADSEVHAFIGSSVVAQAGCRLFVHQHARAKAHRGAVVHTYGNGAVDWVD